MRFFILLLLTVIVARAGEPLAPGVTQLKERYERYERVVAEGCRE